MTLKSDIKDKIIEVLNKDGSTLSFCTPKRANKLILREKAKWIGNNTLQLLISPEDKKQLRNQLIAESNRVCYICGKMIPQDQYPTLDHVYPKSKGGSEQKHNQRCCCKLCNDAKANMTLKEFISEVESNIDKYSWISRNRLVGLKHIYRRW